MSVKIFYAEATDDGQRLDNYLFAHYVGVPKSHLYRMMRTGQVRINSKRVKAHTRLNVGDKIRVGPVEVPERDGAVLTRHWIEVFARSIIHEDEALLIINKPQGLASQRGSGLSVSAIDLAKDYLEDQAYLVHRLDKSVSGILVIAKTKAVIRFMQANWHGADCEKTYRLLCFHDHLPIKKNWVNEVALENEKKQLQNAHTQFHCLYKNSQYALLTATIKTGRKHQIRRHCQQMAMPIVGDRRYGSGEKNKQFYTQQKTKDLFLQAQALTCLHPTQGKTKYKVEEIQNHQAIIQQMGLLKKEK